MGDKVQEPFQLSFNGFLKVDFQGSRVTSDGGLLLVRELDERLGLGKLIDEHLSDTRQGENKKFPLADLLRQSVYSRLAGYEDLNDAVRVSADPTFRLLGSKKNWDRGAALTSRLQSFETGMLAGDENLIGLMAVNRELIAQAEAVRRFRARGARHGLDREPGARPTGRQRLQRPLRVGLLSPAAAVQPARRLSGGEAAAGQRLQRRRLGRAVAARDRAPTGGRQASHVPRRRRLRQAGDLRSAGRARRELRDPHSGEQEPGDGDRRPPVPFRRAGRARSRWCGTRASGIKRRAGRSRDGSSPRSSCIPASCLGGPASS